MCRNVKIKNFQYDHQYTLSVKKKPITPSERHSPEPKASTWNTFVRRLGKFIAIKQAHHKKAHFKQRGDKRDEIAVSPWRKNQSFETRIHYQNIYD